MASRSCNTRLGELVAERRRLVVELPQRCPALGRESSLCVQLTLANRNLASLEVELTRPQSVLGLLRRGVCLLGSSFSILDGSRARVQLFVAREHCPFESAEFLFTLREPVAPGLQQREGFVDPLRRGDEIEV